MGRRERMLAGALVVLGLNSLYLAARADASLLYFANVGLHVVRGVAMAAALGRRARRHWAALDAAVAGRRHRLLARGGARRRARLHRRHAPLPAAPLRARGPRRPRRAPGPRGRPAPNPGRSGRSRARERHRRRAVRPRRSGGTGGRGSPSSTQRHREPGPASCHDGRKRGRGPRGRSSLPPSETNVGGMIPANFFMKSEDCGRCHMDIYQQWTTLGPPLLVVQQPVVPEVHRVHAGRRRDQALEVVRRLPRSRPALQRTSTARSRNRSTRRSARRPRLPSCHSIVDVKGTMGQGDFTIEYPPLHDLATSDSPILRGSRLPAEARPRAAPPDLPEDASTPSRPPSSARPATRSTSTCP